MIFVDRGRVPRPAQLDSLAVADERARVTAHFREPAAGRSQERFAFPKKLFHARPVRDALVRLFHEKCAYCETPFAASSVNWEHFRPKQRAVNLDGQVDQDHYWWLAYEWENLYVVCQPCNVAKATRFPVAGARASPETSGGALASEPRLLLDPCADRPEEHLAFSEGGEVAGRTEMGTVTVETMALNRPALVEARRRRAAELLERLARVAEASRIGDRAALAREVDAIDRALEDDQPYAGMARQVVAARGDVLESARAAARPRQRAKVERLRAAIPSVSGDSLGEAFARREREQAAQRSFSVEDDAARRQYFIKTRLLERVEIENFRPIESLEVRTPLEATPQREGMTAGAPWVMLLGENGTGKSSILQAIALTLMGRRQRDDLGLDASRFVRQGARTGAVRVFLTGSSEPVTLTFSTSSRTFDGAPAELQLLLLGYGATRLLPRGAHLRNALPKQYSRFQNLFDPFVPLLDAASWLASLPAHAFDAASRALKEILQLGPSDRLVREGGPVTAEVLGASVPLEELSDGYQTVIALACDVMSVLMSRWDTSLEIAEGIVILDEMGSHLHPRWRMRIVSALRRAFPRVQFLASTHDPLCLRGLEDGEVAVMRRDVEGRVATVPDLPPVRGLRVDQLLTSEYFGLSSTVDPEVEALFAEYYGLLAKHERSGADAARIAALKGELGRLGQLGADRRERLMLEAIDEYLAEEPRLPPKDRSTARAATKRRVRDLAARPMPRARRRKG